MSPSLSEHLEPELSEARLARNRAAIESKLTQRTFWNATMFRLGTGAAMGLGLAAAAFLLWPQAPSGPANDHAEHAAWAITAGARVAAADAPTTVTLDDGSTIALAAHSALRGVRRADDELLLELEEGEASFDVAHNPERSFRVRSGDVMVRVIGTAFTVTHQEGRVSVSVMRGRVEVERGEDRVVLGAGDRWSAEEHTASAPEHEPVPVLAEVSTPARHPERSTHRDREEEDPSTAARTLFEAAQTARREGRPDSAATLFAELIEQYPGDARAGLAAFELGRIRLDVMHDVPGSIEALERSLALSRHGGYRQDALARLVVLYDRVGESARCREARSRYLSDYPDGVHLTEVEAHCD